MFPKPELSDLQNVELFRTKGGSTADAVRKRLLIWLLEAMVLFRLKIVAVLFLLAPAFAGTNRTIVVSAPRLDNLDLMDVAVAADVTVIERETIEQSGAASIPELIQSEAGVLIRSFSGNSNTGQISMRGFGENSHLRVLVTVDGHKMNRPDMAGIEWQNIPVGSVERIEVIRGGQTVLYGNHALSGVVNITTKKGGDPVLELRGSAGSFDSRAGSVYYSGGFGESFFSVGVNHAHSDGFRTNSLSYSDSVNASAGYYFGETDTLTLRGLYGKSHLQFPGPLTYEQMQDDPTQSGYAGSEHSDSESGLFSLIWETERDWGAARVSSGLNLRDLDWELGGIFANNKQIGVSVAPRIRLGSEDSFFMAGVDLFYDQLDFESYHPDDTDYVQAWAALDRMTTSPYLFAQRSFNQGLIFNGGVRYEYARTDNTYIDYVDDQILPYIDLLGLPSVPNPNYKTPPDADPLESYEGVIAKQGWAAELSVAYEVTEELSFFCGYDRVYRYPTLDESAAYQGFPLSDPLNENLDPETGNNYELGSRFAGREWLFSLTGFLLFMDNEIVYDDSVKLNLNLGETRRAGLEAEVAWSKGWYGVGTRWTFVDARLTGGENEGNRVPLVPWAYGKSSIWVQPFDPMRVALSYLYVSDQFQGGDEAGLFRKMDPYGLVGLRVNIAVAKSVDFIFSIHNLLNETYATSAYYGGFYPGSGRSLSAGISMEF